MLALFGVPRFMVSNRHAAKAAACRTSFSRPDPQALSGGETFQASLAFALAGAPRDPRIPPDGFEEHEDRRTVVLERAVVDLQNKADRAMARFRQRAEDRRVPAGGRRSGAADAATFDPAAVDRVATRTPSIASTATGSSRRSARRKRRRRRSTRG